MASLLHNLLRLDYVSCVLTILGTILLGRKLWQGWVVAAVNSAVVCVIGVRTAQFGFVPANLLCIALYTSNLVSWRFRSADRAAKRGLTGRFLTPLAEEGSLSEALGSGGFAGVNTHRKGGTGLARVGDTGAEDQARRLGGPLDLAAYPHQPSRLADACRMDCPHAGPSGRRAGRRSTRRRSLFN